MKPLRFSGVDADGIPMGTDFPGTYFLFSHEVGELQWPVPWYARLTDLFAEEVPTWAREACWLWESFARPVEGEGERGVAYVPRSSGVARIERLPNELLEMIVEFLADEGEGEARDALAFGLASEVTWAVVLRHVHRPRERRAVDPWAGKEVGFYGNYRAPQGLFIPQSGLWMAKLDWADTHSPPELRPHVFPRGKTMPCQRWMEALHNARYPEAEPGSVVAGWKGLSKTDWENIERDLFPVMYPQDRVWVLRNLTTSEFIRSDKLQPSPRKTAATATPKAGAKAKRTSRSFALSLPKIVNPFTSKNLPSRNPAPNPTPDSEPLTLAQIFLTLTTHTTHPSPHERLFAFHTGRWATHRFDLTPLSAHLSETRDSASQWADVSALAVDDVANLRYWVRMLEGDGERCKEGWRGRVEAERGVYKGWEGWDVPLVAEGEARGRWFKRPVERGVLWRV